MNTFFLQSSGKNFYFPDAVLITGSSEGDSPKDTAELYVPSSGVSCALPELPEHRGRHSVESTGLLCGGYTSDTCLQWSRDTGTWEEVLYLDTGRYQHVSWTPGNGIGTYLMGGWESEMERT